MPEISILRGEKVIVNERPTRSLNINTSYRKCKRTSVVLLILSRELNTQLRDSEQQNPARILTAKLHLCSVCLVVLTNNEST